MALRAGYYGLKRRFKDKLESIALAWDATIKSLFPRSEELILGSKNILPNVAVTDEVNNATFTVSDDKIITVNGTVNAATTFALCTFRLKAGNYIFSGFPGTGTFNELVQLGLKENNISGSDIASMTNTSREEKIFNLANDTTVFAFLYARNGVAFNNNVFKPMIRLASDPDSTYAAPAMTNNQLSRMVTPYEVSVTPVDGVTLIQNNSYRVGDLVYIAFMVKATAADTYLPNGTKFADLGITIPANTTLCGIFNAGSTINGNAVNINASGAMIQWISGYIKELYVYGVLKIGTSTTLTRSAAPDTRSVEEIAEAPEEVKEQPVKKTTRKKSTAKADTKEEV